MNEVLDLIIIGAGPAGLSAAIYATRAMLKFVLLEKSFAGGQVINTYQVENYPGITHISGFDLSTQFTEHATSLGVEIKNEEVIAMNLDGTIKEITTTSNQYRAKTVIFATGALWKKLGVKGEEKYTGLGVSYCATCDGAFYRGRDTVVIGGGDVAVEDAIYLSRMCNKVYLVHRRKELRAVKVSQEKLFNTPNIEVIWDSELEEIVGTDHVEAVTIFNNKTGKKSTLPIDGVFIAIGTEPTSNLLKGKVDMDQNGWIITNEDCETSIKGVFAAGDVRSKSLRQVVTAVADGAIALYACGHYL